MIDKYLSELSGLEEECPGVRVLLCRFHATKYLPEELAKQMCNLSACENKVMKRLTQLLVCVHNDRVYRFRSPFRYRPK
jgi:hypothetical protein